MRKRRSATSCILRCRRWARRSARKVGGVGCVGFNLELTMNHMCSLRPNRSCRVGKSCLGHLRAGIWRSRGSQFGAGGVADFDQRGTLRKRCVGKFWPPNSSRDELTPCFLQILGWLCKLKLSDPSEVDGLMDEAAYGKHTESE
jgi:hypothetical protein